jgi:Cu-Zn family superoxide dismutase
MRTTLASILATAALLAAGCHHDKASTGGTTTAPTPGESTSGTVTPSGKHAAAQMVGTKGHETVKGTVSFEEKDGKVVATAAISGLTPGDHGFHIHEKGDCSAPDGASAGGHFNPSGHKHGSPDMAEHHEGDLGNLTADAGGNASKTITLTDVTIGDGSAKDVVGKGFIIHDKADDFTTQPTGNAGARVACGVIIAQ